MADEESREGEEEEKREGLGYEDLSMNVVPAALTEEPRESGRRTGGLVVAVVAVAVVAVVAILAGRYVLNPHPGHEAEQRLRTRLRALPVWQSGLVMNAGYVTGDRARIGFGSSIRTTRGEEGKAVVAGSEDREKIRAAAREVMEALVSERPGRDLYLDGYIGEEKVARAEYRHQSTLTAGGAEGRLDIVVRVAGEAKGGVGDAYDQRERPRTTN